MPRRCCWKAMPGSFKYTNPSPYSASRYSVKNRLAKSISEHGAVQVIEIQRWQYISCKSLAAEERQAVQRRIHRAAKRAILLNTGRWSCLILHRT